MSQQRTKGLLQTVLVRFSPCGKAAVFQRFPNPLLMDDF